MVCTHVCFMHSCCGHFGSSRPNLPAHPPIFQPPSPLSAMALSVAVREEEKVQVDVATRLGLSLDAYEEVDVHVRHWQAHLSVC